MATYEIGFIVRSLRTLMDMSREDLAGEIIDPSGVTRLENGRQPAFLLLDDKELLCSGVNFGV
ncbi:MAG: helix-turn-helix domain-containing protein [Defluviitaleaceae bacterium]|nr:helix-turn-helix domain-containing protein [Defluviitaleaceae bacterium]MCL2275072.1 helix-turn-helix domain-containing protein [Defluviitaleaceae bacterium]